MDDLHSAALHRLNEKDVETNSLRIEDRFLDWVTTPDHPPHNTQSLKSFPMDGSGIVDGCLRWRDEAGPLDVPLVMLEGDHISLLEIQLVLFGLLKNSFVHQSLEVGVISGDELYGELILQSPEELGLAGGVCPNFLRCVSGQIVEIMEVLPDSLVPLLQVPKLLLLYDDDSDGDVRSAEGNGELRPRYFMILGLGFTVVIPPFCGGSLKLLAVLLDQALHLVTKELNRLVVLLSIEHDLSVEVVHGLE
ncbi:hypothetical protein GUJ93_ZPchr0015g6801 [Zizania palustris]|uniref:Uncharacterized protein n=1 Tax=Zizania palustris TaxID=103762 RepID=A0A8J5T8X5_ZIZPA|nr:hypothetical protein GUJ93_ZPchr0015g6801 [Zizania palustris]